MKIYFDLDDVGNQLSRFLIETYNQEKGENFDWKKNNDFMIGNNPSIQADNSYFDSILEKKGTFLNLTPTPGFIECIHKLIAEGHEVRILTSPKWSSKYCLEEKKEWVQNYLPFFPIENLLLVSKKEEIANKNRVLLDDNPNHLKRWENNGGIGVSFSVIEYSKKWEGYKVKNFEQFYHLINELE